MPVDAVLLSLHGAMIADGELGELTRITWIATNWFRTWAYYASGGWRGTWKLDGGGALMNQGIHGIDLIQWLLGGIESVSADHRFSVSRRG